MIVLFNSDGAESRGFIGDIDQVAIFKKSLSPDEVTAQYMVGKYSPSEYVELMKFDGAEGIYSFDDIDRIVYGLFKNGSNYVDLKQSMDAACAESPTSALVPYKNSISLIIMDSDAAPRDQSAIQNDPQLQGDEQLVTGGNPYQGICTLSWDDDEALLSFTTSISEHTWDFSIENSRAHALRLYFDGAKAGIRVVQLPYENNGEWVPSSLVFDTGLFPVDFRLRGGVGWKAQLMDHSSFITRVYLEDAEHAEYRSAPLRSHIPYQGAQVFKSGTPSVEMVEYFAASDWGGSINSDPMKSTSGKAYRVDTSAANRFEGIRTQRFFVQNIDDIRVRLSVISQTELEIFLYSYETDELIAVHQHNNSSSTGWTEIDETTAVHGAGYYALYITSAYFGRWWVDNVSVTLPTVAWSARPDSKSPWSPLKAAVANSEYGGVFFEHPGKALQIRGISKTKDGNVYDLQIKPKYAELGKFVWRDEV